MATENIAQQMTQTATQAVMGQVKAEEQRLERNKQLVEGEAKRFAMNKGVGKVKSEAMKIEPIKNTVEKANANIEKMTGKAKEAILKRSPARAVTNRIKSVLNKTISRVKKVMAKAMKKASEIKTKALIQASKAKTKAVNAGIDAAGKALAAPTFGASEVVAQGTKQANEIAGKVEQSAIKTAGEAEKKAIDAGTKIGQDMNSGMKDAVKDKAMNAMGLGKVADVQAKINSFQKPKEAGQDVGKVVMKEAGKLAMNALTR